ncbi:efflux RND transporter periplasmic adaptor subunit [Rhodomicrobium lacus]|uniref:efflux RND transporter periplasmic adaptor subunit n=1 Tax=Rhodomicrobium lacus TaxID=2498452 RepID=UPI001FE13082|nr:HlyD family secretion protein [Rhodomicrobium lacus]
MTTPAKTSPSKASAPFLLRFLVTLAMSGAALLIGASLWYYYIDAPWTRDGRVRADVVAVAPDVPGLVTEVLAADNKRVKRGDVLFRIDPERFRLALAQADAVLEGRKAALEQASSDYDRYRNMTEIAVSKQKVEAALEAKLTAKAAYDQAIADKAVAKLNLERSTVRAPVNGRLVNVSLLPGAYVATGQGVFALLDEDSLRVEGYFEETKLGRIHVGDKARIRLMGESMELMGRVESIAAGVEDRERSSGAKLLPNVNPTFSWVRLAMRVPVRIALDNVADREKLVSGRTATVFIENGALKKWAPDLKLDTSASLSTEGDIQAKRSR